MASKGPLPRKVDGLHVQELDGEFVVVNEATTQAHALSGTAAAVWTGIDAGSWPEASDADLDLAVAELQTLGLIESAGFSRRTLMRGGTIAVAGAVITIGLPMATAAASHGPGHAASVNLTGPPTNTGAPFNLDVSVLPDASATAPTGSVSLFTLVGATETPVAGQQGITLTGGTATFTGVTQSATTTYFARYSGDGFYAGSDSGSVTVTTVSAQPNTATITTTPANPLKGATYPITVTVSGTGGTPTGTVELFTTGVVTATPPRATLNPAGQATFTITNPNANSRDCTLQFNYLGDGTFGTATTTVAYTTTIV